MQSFLLRASGGLAVLAFLGGTLTWVRASDLPIGYGDELAPRPPRVEFPLPTAVAAEVQPGSVSAGTTWARVDWPLWTGGAVHIEESIAPLAAGGPQDGVLIGRLSTWRMGPALEGRVNTLSGKVGRFFVSVKAPLAYRELLRIAESLRLSRPL